MIAVAAVLGQSTAAAGAAEMNEPPDTADRPLAVDPHAVTVTKTADLDVHPGSVIPGRTRLYLA